MKEALFPPLINNAHFEISKKRWAFFEHKDGANYIFRNRITSFPFIMKKEIS
jgi:hypothetical protein